jgi:hypothetical protein
MPKKKVNFELIFSVAAGLFVILCMIINLTK